MVMNTHSTMCTYRFSHAGHPREVCGLPAGSDGLCVFHSDSPAPNFIRALEQEVSKQDHWLEGAIIKQDLTGVCLTGARLPKASFEGLRLSHVLLNDALLERANFRSAVLDGVVFHGSNLRKAAFDQATLRKSDTSPVDLRDTELGGVSFTGATVEGVRLLGARFSEATRVVHLLRAPCFEMETGAWDEAATAYGTLGKRAAEDWDFASADDCSYRISTCRHRKAIKAAPLRQRNYWRSPRSYWRDWVTPTFRARLLGWGWMLHCMVWGYGLRPLRALASVLFVIALFGLVVFPGIALGLHSTVTSQDLVSHLLRSIASFVTLDYPADTALANPYVSAQTIEAVCGAVLLSLFLVALAGKYVRRL